MVGGGIGQTLPGRVGPAWLDVEAPTSTPHSLTLSSTFLFCSSDGKDIDPAVTAKEARKARTAKNLKQQQGNIRDAERANPSKVASSSTKPVSRFAAAAAAAAAGVPVSVSEGSRQQGGGRAKPERKQELERRILLGKVSTGSMGKFDNTLKDEPKVKGAKRKFDPTTIPFATEKQTSLNVLGQALGHPTSSKRAKAEGHDADPVLNVRKAVRYEGKREAASRGGRGGGRGGSSRGRGGGGGRGRGK